MTRIRSIELRLVAIPLVRPFRTSFGESTDPAKAPQNAGDPRQPFKWASTSDEVYTPIIGFESINFARISRGGWIHRRAFPGSPRGPL